MNENYNDIPGMPTANAPQAASHRPQGGQGAPVPASRPTAQAAAPNAQNAPHAAPVATAAPVAPKTVKSKDGKFSFSLAPVGVEKQGDIVILYGEPGTGKTTLAAMLPGKTAFIDLENSTGKLKESWDAMGIGQSVAVVNGITDFVTLCQCLQSDIFAGFDNIVIDSLSKVQDWAKEYTFAHSPTKAKTKATSLEDYEFSSGPMYVFRWMIPNFWNPVEAHKRANRNVVIIAHSMFETVPNGDSTEFKQFTFDALAMKSGKDSIRHFMCNNADHVLFLKADVAGDRKKNAIGGDTKTLYAGPLPYVMAKSRSRHVSQFTITPGEPFDWTQIIH